MAALPAKDDISGSGPTPSNAQARAGFGQMWEFLKGLFGITGTASDARDGLGIGSVISYRNLLLNPNFARNLRAYVSGTATTGANQYTLDRWRVVTSGQNVTFGAASPDRTITAPAGGIEQVIEASKMVGGVYTLSWSGTATATVNGVAITNGANTASLPSNTAATVRFVGGTVSQAQFEQGRVVTPFERRDPAVEAAMCHPYYRHVVVGLKFVSPAATVTASANYTFDIPMRAAPTFSQFAAGSALNVSTVNLLATTGGKGYRVEIAAAAAGDSFIVDYVYAANAEL